MDSRRQSDRRGTSQRMDRCIPVQGNIRMNGTTWFRSHPGMRHQDSKRLFRLDSMGKEIPFVHERMDQASLVEGCFLSLHRRYFLCLRSPSEFVEQGRNGFPQQDQVDEDQPGFYVYRSAVFHQYKVTQPIIRMQSPCPILTRF
jgi:hypothetical protein